jgi:ketosteroid isomerase-like protein
MSAYSEIPPMMAKVSGAALPPHAAEFYDAYVARDAARLRAVLYDRVRFQITGPSDQFDFYGSRCGRDEVIELMVKILPCHFRVLQFDFEHVLVAGGRVATYGQVRARQRETGRPISYPFAHFLHFIGDQLADYRAIADTFATAQQLVGHPIDINREMRRAPPVRNEDFSGL